MSRETISMNLGENSYEILLEPGALARAGEFLNLRRRVFIVTDDGVPASYARTVADCCAEAHIETIPQGEDSKNFDTLQRLLRAMLAFGMDRSGCAVAVGGGVVGDLTGFAAACYMRGIDFYNIPTTVLSQVDSSIGGKTAIDLDGVKNIVGAFHQPRAVLVDPMTLATLPGRQLSNGLAEAVKMALCLDAGEFTRLEALDPEKEAAALRAGKPAPALEAAIAGALRIKKRVVEQDEKEHGLRRVLNFGHTLGHGIESLHAENGLLHGECVALGMLPMCGPASRERLLPVLRNLGLPTACGADPDRVMQAVIHDKKMFSGAVRTILSEEPGTFADCPMSPEELRERYITFFQRSAV